MQEQESEKKIKKEEQKENKPEDLGSLHKSAEGFNLIAPQLEKVQEETQKKFRLDIRVVLFVFFVVLISLSIVLYNGYVNIVLSRERKILENLEKDFLDYDYTIRANSQIIERYTFYLDVQEGFISSKEVLNFWQDVSKNLAEIRGIDLKNGVNFEVFGRSSNLRDITRLWHFLSIDDRVQNVTLESVQIPSDEERELSFRFKGVLNIEYFNKRD